MATKAQLEAELAELRAQLQAGKGRKTTSPKPTFKSALRDAIDNPVKSGPFTAMVKYGVRTAIPKGLHGAITIHAGIADDRDAAAMAEGLMVLAEHYAAIAATN